MRICEYGNCGNLVFGTDKNTRIGYCHNHQYLRTDLDRRTPVQKAYDKLKNNGCVNKKGGLIVSKTKEVFGDSSELNRWFDDIKKQHCYSGFSVAGVNTSGANCWECGDQISETFFRHATAHIFPKNIFDSIKTHPLNYLILGAGCGCHDKTHRLDTFSKMKVFKLAVERFEEFRYEIKEKHKYLDEFIKYANNLKHINIDV